MSRKRQRVQFHLDTGGITHLTNDEIKAILRAADELIATGGRYSPGFVSLEIICILEVLSSALRAISFTVFSELSAFWESCLFRFSCSFLRVRFRLYWYSSSLQYAHSFVCTNESGLKRYIMQLFTNFVFDNQLVKNLKFRKITAKEAIQSF